VLLADAGSYTLTGYSASLEVVGTIVGPTRFWPTTVATTSYKPTTKPNTTTPRFAPTDRQETY
jgi:hypothetical protein